jgi:hypothetical protein
VWQAGDTIVTAGGRAFVIVAGLDPADGDPPGYVATLVVEPACPSGNRDLAGEYLIDVAEPAHPNRLSRAPAVDQANPGPPRHREGTPALRRRHPQQRRPQKLADIACASAN